MSTFLQIGAPAYVWGMCVYVYGGGMLRHLPECFLLEKHPPYYIRSAMCRPESTLNNCAYVGQKGVCGRPCFRKVCYLHTRRKSLPLCSACGKRGTTSRTGYCQEISTGCRWRAQHAARRLKAEADMDHYIGALIKSFTPVL